MKKTAFITVLLLALLVVACLPAGATVTPEDRALWIDGWHNGMWNQGEIDSTLNWAYTVGHYNIIVPQMRKKADALFVSNYGGPDGTGEPMVPGYVPPGFDPLQYMIEQAHARGMEVHPWICTHRVATLTTDWFYTYHTNWLTKDQSGTLIDSEGFYLDPGVPDGEDYTVKYALDLVRNYDIDGIQWDRVRYPQQNSGFNDIAIARFKAEYGYTPLYNNPTFTTWRKLQMNSFVSRAYAQIMEIKPWIKVGANTFATYSDASGSRFQDWDAWMLNHWLDVNQPMNYTSDNTLFDNRLQDALNKSYGREVWCGFSLGSNTQANAVYQLGECRTWNEGYSKPWASQTYSYNYGIGQTPTNWFQYVSANSSRPYYQAAGLPAPMSWKSNPTLGIILGQVTNATHPNDPIYHNWVYKATVNLTASGIFRQAITDATGYYVFTDVDPKLVGSAYTITVSKSGFTTQSYTNQAIAAGQVLRADFDLGTTSSTKTISSPPEAVCAGWSLFSLPLDPVNGTPTVILPGLSLNGNLFNWNNVTHSQDMYDEWNPELFGNLDAVDAYTLREVPAPYTISYTGRLETPNRNISLPAAGWAFIGCPFTRNSHWEDIMVTRGSSMVTMRAACKDHNWVEPSGFYWDSLHQSQHLIGLPDDWPEGGSEMQPWHGYWLITDVDGLTLQVRQSAPD